MSSQARSRPSRLRKLLTRYRPPPWARAGGLDSRWESGVLLARSDPTRFSPGRSPLTHVTIGPGYWSIQSPVDQRRKLMRLYALSVLAAAALLHAQPADPGIRSGQAAAGGPIPGLSRQQTSFFNAGKDAFAEVQTVLETATTEG